MFSGSLVFSPILHRITSALLVLVLLASVIGLPISSVRKETRMGKTSERFPCEDCPCGCSTAEYCWDRCCCHSDQEKLRWAAKNSVAPPAFLVRRTKVQKAKACSVNTTKRSYCGFCGTRPTVVCDTEKKDPPSSSETKPTDSEIQSPGVLLWKAAQCRGLDSFLAMLGCMVLTPKRGGSDQPATTGLSQIQNERAIPSRVCPEPPVP